ncbi:MAG: DMT family transporter [Boseongicola sp.]
MAIAVDTVEDNVRLGIVMMLLAWFLFSLVDTGAKWLAIIAMPAAQVAFFRYAGHFVVSVGMIARGGRSIDRFRTSHFWTVSARGALLAAATTSNFYILQFLPLTITSAIMFSSPVIVCLLSVTMLKEKIGPWRWFAIILGFIGVLVVIRPFGETFHPAMLLAVFNAVCLAQYSIMTRQLAGVVPTDTMQFYMGAVGTALTAPLALLTWENPTSANQWWVLIMIGVIAWLGHQLLTHAHRFGTASVLMPFTYSFLIYLAVLSYVFFGHVPGVWTIAGAAIIVASGLIIWRRETSI